MDDLLSGVLRARPQVQEGMSLVSGQEHGGPRVSPNGNGWQDGFGESRDTCGESRSRPLVANEHVAAIPGRALRADQPTFH